MRADENGSPVGLVVAMDAEIHHLMDRFDTVNDVPDGIWLDRYTTLGGLPIIAVRCGIGMVNAAAATERFIDRHQPRAIINFGCAGAHRRDILPGDLVIGERVVNRGAVHILPSGDEYFVGLSYEVGGEQVVAAELAADPELIDLAIAAARQETPIPWPRDLAWPDSVPYREPRVFRGVVGSSDSWTQSQARIELFHQRHQSLCEDMEAAAIGQVCAMHGVPFLTIKDISNNEFHIASDITGSFGDFPTAEVGRRAAQLVYGILSLMARPIPTMGDGTKKAPLLESGEGWREAPG